MDRSRGLTYLLVALLATPAAPLVAGEAPVLEISPFPSLSAALADLGAAVGAPLSPQDATRVSALEARLDPAARAAIVRLVATAAAASRAHPLGAEPGSPSLDAASAAVREASERASATLRGLLAEGGCVLDCSQATIVCVPFVGCPLPGGFGPDPCPPPDVTGFEPNCQECPPGQAGIPGLPPPAGCQGMCPAGMTGTPPACVPACPPSQGGTPPACIPACLPPPVGAPPACVGALGACAMLPSPFTVAPLFSLGTPANEGYLLDVILSIDLGGDDAYCNNAGSTHGSGNPFPRCAAEFTPVAVLLEFEGDDAYHSVYKNVVETDTVPTFCFEGSSSFGIAWFQDVEGNDAYNSDHLIHNPGLAAAWCAGQKPAWPNWPTIVAPTSYYDATLNQGATVAGYAFMEDRDGNDRYNSDNIVCTRYYSVACLLVHVAQGAAHAPTGQGYMHDERGNDSYNSRNWVTGSNMNIIPLPGVTLPPPPCLPSLNLPVQLPIEGNEDTFLVIRDVQGAALQGVGELRDDTGQDTYNGANKLDADWAGLMTTEPARLAIECAQGCGVVGGQSHHLDNGGGNDTYNDGNSVSNTGSTAGGYLGIRCVQGVTAEGTPWPAETHCLTPAGDNKVCGTQPVCPRDDMAFPFTPDTTRGVLEDRGGHDRYNSRNRVAIPNNDGIGRLLVLQAQGSSEGGEGRFEERSGNDCFNCENTAGGSLGLVAIEAVQGNVHSFSGLGTMLSDEGGAGDDEYNARNAGKTIRILYAQATSSAPPGSWATARLHEDGGRDDYNTGNVGTVLFQLLGAQAAIGRSPTLRHDGIVDFADDAGADTYNMGNAPATCAGNPCVDWTTCTAVGTVISGVSFLDQGTPTTTDTWNAAPASYGFGKYNGGASLVPRPNCNDLGDTVEMPAGHRFGLDT